MSNVISMQDFKNSKPVKITDLKPGVTVFKVYAVPLANESLSVWIEKLLIMGVPYENKNGLGLFVDYKKTYKDGFTFNDSFSLRDANIDADNGYNNHRTFSTIEAAEKYQARISDPQQWTSEESAIFKQWIRSNAMFDLHHDFF